MKISLMTAVLVLAPTLALASPGSETAVPPKSLTKEGAVSAAQIAFEKKQLRLHVIERAQTRAGNLSGPALHDLCNGPTKILRHACVKGEGGSSARLGTAGEELRSAHDEPNRRQSHNRRQALNAENGGSVAVKPLGMGRKVPSIVKKVVVSGQPPAKLTTVKSDATLGDPPAKLTGLKPEILLGEKPTGPADAKPGLIAQR